MNNQKIFDSTKTDESQYQNILTALSQIRYAELLQLKMNLGVKALLYKKLFNNLFDLTTVNSNLETREILHYKDFQEFKNKFNPDQIKSHVKRIDETLPFIKDKSIIAEYKHVQNLLNHFLELKTNC